jgi:hypothetical protein
MSEQAAMPHPAVLTDEDFNMLYWILGVYVGREIGIAREDGNPNPMNAPAVLRAREVTIRLKEKLEALQHTR